MKYRISFNDAFDVAKTKVPEGCKPYAVEHVIGGFIINCETKSGDEEDDEKVVVSDSEMNAFAQEYERTTGKCWNCKGSGQAFAGWSKDEGTKTRPCERCQATGAI